MKTVHLADAPDYDSRQFVARPFLEGSQTNVRIIRLAPGQVLPPHRHGSSDLMLYVVEGDASLDTIEGTVPFPAGTLAFYSHDEELRVSNPGTTGVTLLAFLAPKFATT